jgi:excisionase family DNA binding protein
MRQPPDSSPPVDGRDALITVSEAAKRLGVSRQRVDQYIRDGRLAVAQQYETLRLVRAADIDALLAQRAPTPPAAS